MQGLGINNGHVLEEGSRVFSSEMSLTHMGDIEYSAGLSGVEMFFHNSTFLTRI